MLPCGRAASNGDPPGVDMLLLINQAARRQPTIAEVARELSLIVQTFTGPDELVRLIGAKTRKLVYLSADDLAEGYQDAVCGTEIDHPIGVIACTDRDERLAAVQNVEWVSDAGNVDAVRLATRLCWQRMLRITEGELKSALARRELVIQYQPKVERSDGIEWKTREAESLLRWRHPQHGLLGPLEFLPEAEAFGLMGRITELVLTEASLQLLRWRKQGMELNSCINLAPSLLADPDFADRCETIVTTQGLDCANFTFEVPENDITNSDAPHLRALQRLRDKGFRISLDDFGVAASSLSAFEQLPFDEIKIHAAALQRARANPVAQQVLAAVTGLAHNLGVSVCAEGVEDQDTFEFLKTIECDKMQGFLISEAVMPEIIRIAYSTADDVDEVA